MQFRPATCAAALCCVASLLFPPATARGQSVHNLERNLPLEIQDTAPADTGKAFVQASAVNERHDTSADRLTLQPTVQWGFAENAHLQVTSPFYLSDDEDQRRGSGDVQLGMLYNFLAEGQAIPSLAALGEVIAPTGVGSEGFDFALTLIATKQITKETSEDRLHFNSIWIYNDESAADERENRFEFVVGYSRKLTDRSVLVVDFFHRQELLDDTESTMMEIGFLYQLSPRNIIGASIGTGLDEDSPDVRMGISFQTILGP